jgi:hypothetical protein
MKTIRLTLIHLFGYAISVGILLISSSLIFAFLEIFDIIPPSHAEPIAMFLTFTSIFLPLFIYRHLVKEKSKLKLNHSN